MNKLLLLIWKNFILRKKHRIITFLEILFPILCVIGVGAAKSELGRAGSRFIFPVVEEDELKLKVKESIFCANCTVAYTPKNTLAEEIVGKLKNCVFGATTVDWRSFDSEQAIESYYADVTSNSSASNSFRAAIVFEEGLDLVPGSTSGIVSYKIRLESGKLPSNRYLFQQVDLQSPGSDWENSKGYADSGFIGLQICIDKVLIERMTKLGVKHEMSLQPFPYPAFRSTALFHVVYFNILPTVFVIGFIFLVPSITRPAVSEKETGIRELLKLNGLGSWIQWLGWLLNSLLIHIITITIVAAFMFIEIQMANKRNGALFEHSNYLIWWLVLLLYVMSATSFCLFICSFFTNPALATSISVVLWIATFQGRVLNIRDQYDTLSLTGKMSYALLPNIAMWLATRVISSFEEKGEGIRWTNIGKPISSEDPLCLAHIILMFILNTLLYAALSIYLENVLPSTFGVRKPWYYTFLPRTYFRCKVEPSAPNTQDNPVMPSFEEEPSGADVGVDIRNLRKNFGKNKVAVDGVSMKMYEGEIFVLVGHNGAGKTATISMLTGMFAPSGGTALINGFDITTTLGKARDNLGLCPQQNMLFDELTVLEHLIFFGLLKGLETTKCAFFKGLYKSNHLVNDDMLEILRKLHLVDEAYTFSKNLSGGLKRKLSLGIALIGDTEVAILDEPTSGLDPEAQRAVWNLLQEMREDRTILLSTHQMEEADVLADRIGIMSSGKLQCCGSPIFLKKFYGTGYTLKLSLSEEEKQEDILQLVQKYIADAARKNGHANRLEMLISLPENSASSSALSEMFTELTALKEELGIKTVGLALTTIDEVFLRVGELANSDVPTESTNKEVGDEKTPSKITKVVGLKLVMQQFLALLIKKYIYTYRNWKLIITQLIIPILLLSFVILLNNDLLIAPEPPPPLQLKLDSYASPVTLAASSDTSISSQLASVIGSSYKEVPGGTSLEDALFAASKSNIQDYRTKYIVALEASPTKLNAMFNTIPYHAAPLAINLASNLLLKSLDSRDLSIRVSSHPLNNELSTFLAAASPDAVSSDGITFSFGLIMPLGLALLAASFILFPIEERIEKAKQLQMMTGISPLTYWYSSFLCDFLQVFLVVCSMMLCFLIFQHNGFFTSYGGGGSMFLILLAFGFAAISFSYLFSLFAKSASSGFSRVSMIQTAAGVVLNLVGLELLYSDTVAAAIFRWMGRLFPVFGVTSAIMRFAQIATRNGRCNVLTEKAKKVLCDPSLSIQPESRQCCANCQALPDVTCFEPVSYLTWSYRKKNGEIVWGIGEEVLVMVVLALVYHTLLLILEYKIPQQIWSFCRSLLDLALKLFRCSKKPVFENDVTDDDVIAEVQRVADMVKNGTTHEEALVVENFCKSYGKFPAVSMLNFGVRRGECFGLLGVNGGGKTTTFEMLTGDKARSSGNAYAFGKALDKNRKEFLSNIGFCPQFDALIGVLSGRQMLQLFGRLRGVPGSIVKDEADKWLGRVGLLESADVQCRKYSGGMKRRLSIAISMIGDPPLLLLDEPTSGVDPVSRRQFWDVLRSVRDSGQAIILTSHSMEECEALCSRLGIMVNGQLQCVGGVQHLKNKFAQGYTLSVKLKPLLTSELRFTNINMKNEIYEKFEPCVLRDKHKNVLQFHLYNTALGWDELFKTMEDIKNTFEDIIEDYSLNETSLEEVFLIFARKQKENVKIKEKKKKERHRQMLAMQFFAF